MTDAVLQRLKDSINQASAFDRLFVTKEGRPLRGEVRHIIERKLALSWVFVNAKPRRFIEAAGFQIIRARLVFRGTGNNQAAAGRWCDVIILPPSKI